MRIPPSKTLLEAAAVALLMAFTYAVVYGAHSGGLTVWYDANGRINEFMKVSGANTGYDYPFHHDEWVHLTRARYILEGGGLDFVAPQYKRRPFYPDFEPGFHLFLAFFFRLTGMDPVLGYKYLPAACACVGALCAFILTRQLSGSFRAGIFSMLFFAALRSNTNMLGVWFFVPFTMVIPMTYLSAILFLRGLHDDRRYFLPFLAVMIVEMAVYAAYALLLMVVLCAYLVFHLQSSRRDLWVVGVIASVSAAGVAGFCLLAASTMGVSGAVSNLIGKVVFRASEEISENWFVAYNPLTVYGVFPCILAFIGLYAVSMNVYGRRKAAILIPWILLVLVSLLAVRLYGVTLLARQARIMYFGLLAMVPLSALGLDMVAGIACGGVSRILGGWGRRAAPACVVLLASAAFLITFDGYYTPQLSLPYHFIERQDYDAIKWAESVYGSGNVILAPPPMSDAIYPISGNYVVEGNTLDDKGQPFIVFIGGDCNGGWKILEDNDVDLVISRWRLQCPEYLNLVYDTGDYVYEVNKTVAASVNPPSQNGQDAHSPHGLG